MNTDRTYSVLVPMVRPLVKGRMGAGRRRYFDAVGIAKGRVLFLGDSITEGGMWPDLFPDLATSNRGIGGEATYDLLERLDGALNDPAVVCLMIGTNDLHGPRELRRSDQVVGRMDEILRRIREAAPSALVLVNSGLPRTEHFAPRIRAINEGYRKVAGRHGAEYVDLWPAFVDASGEAIRTEYSKDNLHLTPAGYLAWAEVLRPLLAPYALRA